jgi:glycerol-3-phosphate dehydrogenase (NAD(P)+)
MEIGVIGAGSWGTALAILLGNKGFKVSLWVRKKDLFNQILHERVNGIYLPQAKLPPSVNPTTDLQKAVSKKDLLVISVPSHVIEDVVLRMKDFIERGTIIVNTAKGLESKTWQRLSLVIKEHIAPDLGCEIAVLSGPNHAEEVSLNIPTATVVAAEKLDVAETVQDVFMSSSFRVYTNPDIAGVELGGALKNVIAIGAGVCEGLNYGDNTKAALLTRGLTEITRLGVVLGAHRRTFSGLSGMGDLIVTCTSSHSRNRYVGLMLGRGKTLEEITLSMNMVAEGIRTTKAAYHLSKQHGVEMPITKEVYGILFLGVRPEKAVLNLMKRDKTHEIENLAFD